VAAGRAGQDRLERTIDHVPCERNRYLNDNASPPDETTYRDDMRYKIEINKATKVSWPWIDPGATLWQCG
jgi:hypothetical protein